MRFPLSRLFRRKKPLDVEVANMHVSAEWLKCLQEDDQFLVSFPRSGNRWVRTMLRDVIVLSHPEMALPQKLKVWLPDIHTAPPSAESKPQSELPSRIIKSHNFNALKGRRMGYVFRQAADALVSFYHFHLKHEKGTQLGIDQFCIAMLPAWCEHIQLALDQARLHPERTHLISYEAMKTDPLPSLRALARFYGLETDDSVLQKALDNNTFERSRAQTPSMDRPKGPILRQGRVGSAKGELSPEVFGETERVSAPLYEEITAKMQA